MAESDYDRFMEKVNAFGIHFQEEQIARLRADKLDCPNNIQNSMVNIIDGNKYIKVDTGTCGRYMVEKSTGIIYGIKGYGKVHKGHQYGTVDTFKDWYWGKYYAERKKT